MPRKTLRRPTRPLARPDTDNLYVRGIPSPFSAALTRGARSRGLTLGQYLVRLALLHAAVREAAGEGDERAGKILATLGLETVTA